MQLRGSHLFLLAALVAFALVSSATARADVPAPGDFAPSVWSDKADYSPGGHVVLSGANWQAGESVHITVNDDAGSTWNRAADVTADAAGAIADEFNLPDWFVAKYSVRAEGSSGAVATTSFTDGNVKFDVTPTGTTTKVTETVYSSTNCDPGTVTSGPTTLTGTSGHTVGGMSADESVRLAAEANSDQGGTFTNWTGDITTTSNTSICVRGSSGSVNVHANYTAPPSNQAPVIAANNATRTTNEGTIVTNTGTWSDANAGDTVTLSASVGAVTKSGTNASGTWSWSYTPGDGPTSPSPQVVTITANDAHGGVTNTTFALTVDNVPPTATLSAPDVDEGQSITVSLTSPQDVAADLPGLQYAFDCGSGYGAFTAANSTSCATTAHGTKTVKAKIRDKDNGETEYTRVVTVRNAAPVAGTVAITPSSATAPTTNSTLTATPSGFSDPGGDSLSYHYTWTNGSTVVGIDSDTLDLSQAGNGDKGDTISVSVTASDGTASSGAATDSVTVKNSGPSAGTVAITPSSSTAPTTNSTLTATPAGFSDADGDSLAYHFTWKHGSTVVGIDSDTLDLSDTGNGDKGDTITVSVTASDGDDSSSAASDDVTVKNTPPSVGTVAISPSSATAPTTNSTLTATPAGFSDADGDSLAYHFTWKHGSTVVGIDSDTLDLSDTGNGDKGDTITVSVTASDGDDSSSAASDSTTVKNAAPTANAGGGADGYSGQEGVAVQLNGSSADADGDTRTYDWSSVTDSGSGTCSFDDHTSADPKVTCTDNGSFTMSLTVTDSDGASSNAATAPLAIDNVAPTATWNRPSSAVNEGDSFTLSLTDPQDVVADTPGLEYRFDCGTGTYNTYSSDHSRTCPTSDDGTLSVAAQVRDKDNGVRTYTDDITVDNVAPTIASFTGTSALAGPLVFVPSTFTTQFSDPGNDSWFASFSYSDGVPSTERTPGSGFGFAPGDTVTHRFATAGCSQTATVRVTDDDDGVSNEQTATVSVGTGAFLAPLANQPVSDKLKNGQVLPVKVRIADCNGIPVMNLTPAIKLVKGDLTSVADDTGQVISISSVSAADSGTTMRPADGFYIYNLRVSVASNQLGQDFTIIVYPYGSDNSGATLRHVIIPTK